MAKKEKVKLQKPSTKKEDPKAKNVSGVAIPPQKEGMPFHVVGIGASAGGLEAFEHFFTNMPADNGMAFILITHLNPTHISMMPDLIKKYTRMKVYQIEDGMKVEPDCVFVTPPNKDIAILKGTLQLMEPPELRGLRLPIDYFFRSLAVIGHNCILPQFRQNGYGKQQINEILKRFREMNFKKAIVSTNEHECFYPAQRMYLACGFREKRKFFDGKNKDYVMIEYDRML